MYREEKELDDDLDEQFDQIELTDLTADLSASNKRLLDEVEEMSVDTFTIVVYGLSSKKACNG